MHDFSLEGINEHYFYKNSKALHLWVELHRQAVAYPTPVEFDGGIFQLQPGQLLTSRKRLSTETGINESAIQRILMRMETAQLIEQLTSPKSRVITILSLAPPEKVNRKVNHKRTTNEHNDVDKPLAEKEVDLSNLPSKLDQFQLISVKGKHIEIPGNLQSDSFTKIWQEWETHRKQLGKSLTPITVTRQLKKLSKFGEAGAVRSLEASMENGWTGVFDPPPLGAPSGGARPRKETNAEKAIRAMKARKERNQ